MDTKWKVIAVAVVGAVVGFMLDANSPLGMAIWGEAPAGPEPSGTEVSLLILVSVLQAIGFGLGVAFLVFGWAYVRAAPVSNNLALAAYLAIGWNLVSWVPHTAMHVTNAHDDFMRLILIEYLFHVTLVATAAILAWFFVQIVRGLQPSLKKADAKPMTTPAR